MPVLILVLLANTVTVKHSYAQKTAGSSVYKVNRKIEIPLTLGLFGGVIYGFDYLSRKPGVTYEQAISLKPSDVWWFDRPAALQDAGQRLNHHNSSDVYLRGSVLAAGVLMFDKAIRNDWFDVLILYGESHAISSGIYVVNTSLVNRPRPFNYNPDVPVEDKMANETRNSFFSGHVSSAATASFFTAKVFSDYHPEMGSKKYWLFAAAAVPPTLVAYYRYKAMKHFPTDVITGFAVGATCGVLIPHLHKNKNSSLSLLPFAGELKGLKASYTF